MNHKSPDAEPRPASPAPPRPAAPAHPANTRETILDTAERLFAERGFAATSVRDITAAADANLGAINYHFGTKLELAAAVFSRRLGPVGDRQSALLDEVEKNAGEAPPRLEAVLEAMIRPSIERSFEDGKRNLAFMHLVGRCLSLSEPNPDMKRWIRTHVQKVMTRAVALLERALPGLPREELLWRFKFTMGALHNTLLTTGHEDDLPPALRKGMEAEILIRRLVTFAAAGMRAEK